mgnify:CR=1 FL=1
MQYSQMEGFKDIRPSPIAGSWYASDPLVLAAQVDRYINEAVVPSIDDHIIGVIAPHAGYIYSGRTAGHAFRLVKSSNPELVIILSPLHAYVQGSIITSGHDAYATPLGNVPVDNRASEQFADLCSEKNIPLYSVRKDREHSLEIELPFLQRSLAQPFSILPIMIRQENAATLQILGDILAAIAMKRNTLLVGSTDLSHFYSQKQAEQLDGTMLKAIEACSPDAVLRAEQSGTGFACGAPGIAVFLWAAKALGADKCKIIHHSTSADETGDTSSVVGYGAGVVYKQT